MAYLRPDASVSAALSIFKVRRARLSWSVRLIWSRRNRRDRSRRRSTPMNKRQAFTCSARQCYTDGVVVADIRSAERKAILAFR